jgi:AcrR family transcriptional regulator
MSTRKEETRRRLLDSALHLLTKKGYFGVGLEEVAREANVSRQALYLHFKSKAELLVAVARHLDEQVRTPEIVGRLATASNPIEAIELGVVAFAAIEPQIYEAAAMLHSVRKQEEAAEAAWQDRMAYRRGNTRRVIEWLEREGQLAAGWSVDEAIDFAMAVLSPFTYELLILERGWPVDRFVHHLTDVIKSTLVRPIAPSQT